MTITVALAAAGLLAAAASPLQAQPARSYCLISPGGEPGGCDFPTLQACLVDSAGFGSCIASDRPAAEAAVQTVVPTKRKR